MSSFALYIPAQESYVVEINYEWGHTGEDKSPLSKEGDCLFTVFVHFEPNEQY